LRQIIDEYQRKYKSGLNLNFLKENETFKDLRDYDKQTSMFDEKRLIVVYKTFSSEKIKNGLFENYEEIASSENIFVLYEEGDIKKGDKLLKLLSTEKKRAMIQEFCPLSGKKLSLWIKKEFEKRGSKVSEDAVLRLQETGGEDLWRIKNEIAKLSLYKKEIKKEDVDYMVSARIEADIFKTIDAMAEKNKEKALFSLYNHLEKGDSPLYLLSMIIYQFRNLIIVSELLEKDYSYEVAKEKSGLHPFVFKKTRNQTEKFSLEELRKIYDKLFEIDLQTKTGQIDPVLGLHLFLFS